MALSSHGEVFEWDPNKGRDKKTVDRDREEREAAEATEKEGAHKGVQARMNKQNKFMGEFSIIGVGVMSILLYPELSLWFFFAVVTRYL